MPWGSITTFLFMLCSVQIHELRPLAVKSLKALSDRIIADQHFTCRDFADAVSLWCIVFFYLIPSYGD
jgi:hypothetical protein